MSYSRDVLKCTELRIPTPVVQFPSPPLGAAVSSPSPRACLPSVCLCSRDLSVRGQHGGPACGASKQISSVVQLTPPWETSIPVPVGARSYSGNGRGQQVAVPVPALVQRGPSGECSDPASACAGLIWANLHSCLIVWQLQLHGSPGTTVCVFVCVGVCIHNIDIHVHVDVWGQSCVFPWLRLRRGVSCRGNTEQHRCPNVGHVLNLLSEWSQAVSEDLHPPTAHP